MDAMDISIIVSQNESLPENMDFVSSLPLDIRYKILTEYVGAKGIARLEQTSSTMVDVCRDEAIWRKLCCMIFGVKVKDLQLPYKHTRRVLDVVSISPATPVAFYSIYTQLLYPLRGYFNCILVSFSRPYGAILTLSYQNGVVFGELWTLQREISANLNHTENFALHIDEATDELKILCGAPFYAEIPHCVKVPLKNCVLIKRTKSDDATVVSDDVTTISFSFLNHLPTANSWGGEGGMGGIGWVLTEANLFFQSLASLRKKGCGPVEGVPDGLFKGSYGGHGSELLLVQIEELNGVRELVGLKLSGDPNVPAGKVSFRFPLTNHVRLRLNEQFDVQFLEGLQTGEQFLSNGPFFQPFRLPIGHRFLDRRSSATLPDNCLGRLVGSATIAALGFRNAQSIVAHIVFLTSTRFLVLWLGGLNTASLFEKVSDTDRFAGFL